jgi:hypothetical protein
MAITQVELLHVWRAGLPGERREAQFGEEIARVGEGKLGESHIERGGGVSEKDVQDGGGGARE